VADPSGCDVNCQTVAACNVIARDPAIIRFGDSPDEPDYFSMHGSFVPRGFVDPVVSGMVFLLTNANGVIYQANLLPGDLLQAGTRYSFKDPGARQGTGQRDGLYQVTVKQRVKNSQLDYSFKIRAYGDFSAATEPLMMLQVKFGGDGAINLGEWQQAKRGWKLFPVDY
jgi:hypothetical protein